METTPKYEYNFECDW